MKLTLEQLKACMPLCKAPDKWLDPINQTLEKYQINTPLRVAHFFAQIMHESNQLNAVVENLNYSSDLLRKTFPKYFPDKETADKYARKPEMIANKVYANRMENGDEKSGDGWKFRGRSPIQCTGKANYILMGKTLNEDFIKNPDLLIIPQYSMLVAGVFWDKNKLNQYADKDDVLTITKRINGGINGLDERKHNLINCKKVLIDPKK